MRENNRNYTRCKISQTLVGWFAFLVLLSPLSVQMANGQVLLTITILINAVADDPPAPATEPSDPPPATEPGDPPAAEVPVDPPQVEPPPVAESGAAEPTEPTSAESTNGNTQEPAAPVKEPANEPANEPGEQQSDAGTGAGIAEVTAISEESPLSVQPTPPLERPLSVGPVKSLLPEDRPNWITLEPDYSSDAHRFVVPSIPTTHESDVDVNLDAPLEEALRSYVAEQFADDRAGSLLSSRLSAAFIRANLVDDKKSYTAELTTTSGGMFQKWVMVEVSDEQREQLQTWYREQMQRERILPLGLGVAGLLSVVGLLNLVFRKAAGKASSQPLKLVQVDQVATKQTCCSKKGSWGFAVAIAIAIAVAIFAG